MKRLSIVTTLLTFGFVGACDNGPPTCDERGLEEFDWFRDEDRDGYGNPNDKVTDCVDADENGPEGYIKNNTDCDDLRPSVYPTGPELCDGLDNNCNGAIDDGLVFQDYWLDNDGDTYGDPNLQVQACSIPPGAAERPNDCDDTNPAINPDAVEICDAIDNDCDELVDDDDNLPITDGGVDLDHTGSVFHPDVDGDSYGDWAIDVLACTAPPHHVADASDCNDVDPQINPDNAEICNGIDDDCDQLYDDSDDSLDVSTQTVWYIDTDADGYGDPHRSIQTCTTPWFYSLNDQDCDDDNPLVLSATDTYWLPDLDGDGFGAGHPSHPSCTPPANTGWASQVAGEDCDDTDELVNPDAIEVCDGIDNDCDVLTDDFDDPAVEGGVDVDTMTDWYLDADDDGWGDLLHSVRSCIQPPGMVAQFGDCDDTIPTVNPGQPEICNFYIDDDCNGVADDQDSNLDVDSGVLFVEDADGDGWGNLDVVERACAKPVGFVALFGDCDDTDPFIQLPTTWWYDADGDGQGAGVPQAPATCDPPAPDFVPHYVNSEEDCAVHDPLQLSGPEICYDGIDQGCDGNDFTTSGDCELDLPDTCADAQAFNPIVPAGQVITGTLANAHDDLSPDPANAHCTGRSATGAEELIPLSIAAGATVEVRLTIDGGDSAVYLLPSCSSTDSCVAGADVSGLGGTTETVVWTNDTAHTVIVYAVLDAAEPSDSRAYTAEFLLH